MLVQCERAVSGTGVERRLCHFGWFGGEPAAPRWWCEADRRGIKKGCCNSLVCSVDHTHRSGRWGEDEGEAVAEGRCGEGEREGEGGGG